MLLILASGLFAEELITLPISNFHLYKGYLNIVGEEKRERKVPLDLALCKKACSDWLMAREELLAGEEYNLLFFSQHFLPLSKRMLYKMVHETLVEANIYKKDMGPDMLRQTALLNMFKNGMSLEEVQQNTGIKTLERLKVYKILSTKLQ